MPERLDLPDWARWSDAAAERPWTVGVEEEVMLLDGGMWSVANRAEAVLAKAPGALANQASAETHACVLEVKTGPHRTVAGAASELTCLRESMDAFLRNEFGLRAAVAGTHPLATGSDVEISRNPRYREIEDTTQAIAHREPTMALHVHVAVPDPATAVQALDGMRTELPLLLALSANSPFLAGADSGFASMRMPVFSMFPRTGMPRQFESYDNYVRVVDGMVALGLVPEPGFLWWDIRLQPRLGTVEVRIMDAQTNVGDAAALAAFVQCLVRHHAQTPRARPLASEVLEENRFLAARDGVHAVLVDTASGRPRPLLDRVSELLDICRPIADELGCSAELARVGRLAINPGDARQRRLAAQEGLDALPAILGAEFLHAGQAVATV